MGGQFGDEVFAKAEIFDIGTTGTASPLSIGNHTATIYDVDLVNSTEFEIQLSGTKWGGSEYLDDFIFSGIKGSSNCTITGLNHYSEFTQINIFPNPMVDEINISLDNKQSNLTIKTVYLYDSVGQLVISKSMNNKVDSNLRTYNLNTGIYLLSIETSDGNRILRKIIKR